ncbi:MAG: hypothetical protein KY466_12005 [Gemmatimonadetes bacterium]|nr:hypothetical protein [Gemmatimonadota bacterium]
MRSRAGVASVALLLLAATGPAAGQEIAGVAVDSAGRPLAGVPLALHRVGGGSGANVATGATDAEGRFRFAIEVVDSAVYFVAMRHDDRMYIGPPARGGSERVTDYLIRAAPASEAGAVASALAGADPRPAPSRPASPPATGGTGAVWLVPVLGLVVAAIVLATAPGYRRRRQREMLLELARVEDRLAAAGSGGDPQDHHRRQALRERLAPPA